ncbi:MAG: NEW3 domain-containing protein [Acetivibrionales bacterium]
MVSKQSIKQAKPVILKFSLCLLIVLALVVLPSSGMTAVVWADGGLSISTSYPGITVKAGEDVSFTIRVDNNGATAQNIKLAIEDIPDGWEAYFEGMGKQISRVFVKSNDFTTVSFNVKIPPETSEGSYRIVLAAAGDNYASNKLELDLDVSEKEMVRGKFIAQYPELQGPSGAIFKFKVDLANNGSKDQSYSLGAQAPRGWEVSFKPSYEDKKIASLSLEPGKSQGLEVEIKPPSNVKAEKYTIPVFAVSAEETLSTELSIIITGSYDIKLTTPTGRLNADAYSGKETPVTLTIINDGSADLKDVNLSSWQPSNWSVRFEPETLDIITAGESKEVKAFIQPSSDAIAGDYAVSLTASVPETSSTSEFRVTVKTPTTWGIAGIVIILLLAAGLMWVFRTYGRR